MVPENIENVRKIQDYNFLLDQVLGEGTFGTVYLGYKSQSPEIPLAIKQIKLNSKTEEDIATSCLREVKILRTLENKNIVKFYDAFRTTRNIYMIYEYCDGGDLDKLRKSSKNNYLSEAQTLVFMRHICNGYRDLLENNIIHRDLKPANILLHEGEAKIADFGTARHCDPLQKIKMTQGAGTPLYISPENYTSSKYDEKCDVWSFGIMVFELLYGETPWNGKNEYDLFVNHILKEELKFPSKPKRSKMIKELIQNMLVVEPKNRISWEELFESLAKFDDVEDKIENTIKVGKRKLKPVIGDLYDDRDWKNKGKIQKEENKEDYDYVNRNMGETKVKLDPNKKKMLEKKEILQKNQEKAKEMKNSIFFNRNLSSFFGTCSFLLNWIYEKKILDLSQNDFLSISGNLNYFESEFIWKAKEQFESLKKKDLLSAKEVKKLGREINEDSMNEEFKPKKGPIFGQLNESLKKFLKNVSGLFFENEEILEFSDYDQDFFKLICFCLLIAKAEEPKNILKEMEKEDITQMFYKFYDKYEHMEKEEFKIEIKNEFIELKLN